MTYTFGDGAGAAEVSRTLGLWRLWVHMSWQDIRQRYRGSVLGPFWIAGGIAAASLGAGLLYSRVLRVDTHHLVAFVSVGVAVWTLIALTLTEACHAFVGSAGLIRNTNLPRPLHILRVLNRNLIVFAHGLLVVGIVFVVTGVGVGPQAFLAVPGLLLVVANLIWAGWFLALLSTRFRDAIQLTAYGLQFAIFITPIFWYPELAGRDFAPLLFNPFYHLVEVVRGPLMGGGVAPESWWICAVMAVVGLSAAAVSFRSLHYRVAYWL